jgi:heptosyltransferase-3
LDKFCPQNDQEPELRRPLQVSVTPPSVQPLPQDLMEFVGAGPTVVIHATPMWKFKRWPIKNWAELISALVAGGKRVILTGSSSQQDRDLNGEILARVAQDLPATSLFQVRDCAGQLTLGQTTALLKLAQVYIGVDTSVTHLAAACGIQTIALFGATAPPNFGPWPKAAGVTSGLQSVWALLGEEHADGARIQTTGNIRIIQGPGKCVPCRKAGCLDKFESHSDCLDQLSPRAVMGHLPV